MDCLSNMHKAAATIHINSDSHDFPLVNSIAHSLAGGIIFEHSLTEVFQWNAAISIRQVYKKGQMYSGAEGELREIVTYYVIIQKCIEAHSVSCPLPVKADNGQIRPNPRSLEPCYDSSFRPGKNR